MASGPIGNLDAGGVLAALEATTTAQRRAAVEELMLALHWADLHSGDPQDEPGAQKPCLGGDRLIALGGEGTPKAQELCWEEFAIARHTGVIATQNLAADALDLRHRLPGLWSVIQSLVMPAWVGRKVASMSRELGADRVGLVDSAVTAAAHESPGRILAIAEAKVIEADPERHRAKVTADAAKVGVFVSRPRTGDTVDPFLGEPGSLRVTMKLGHGSALELDALIDQIADGLAATSADPAERDGEDPPTRDQLRAKAAELLADPHAAAQFLDRLDAGSDDTSEATPEAAPQPSPQRRKLSANLTIHLTANSLGELDGIVARVDGLGPVLLDQIAGLVGHRNIALTPVVSLAATRSVNAYEHPTDVKQRTIHRVVYDAFPHSTSMSSRVDHDHVTPYDPGGPPGQTGDHNDSPLTRRHHRAKTHKPYDVRQLGLGTYRWTTPHGLGRLVTRFGTRPFTPVKVEGTHLVGEIYYQ